MPFPVVLLLRLQPFIICRPPLTVVLLLGGGAADAGAGGGGGGAEDPTAVAAGIAGLLGESAEEETVDSGKTVAADAVVEAPPVETFTVSIAPAAKAAAAPAAEGGPGNSLSS